MTIAMRSLGWEEVTLAGAVEQRPTATGLHLSRLPEALCRQLDDPMLSITAAMAAGMRLLFHTDATVLEVEAQLTGLHYLGGARRPIAFDLWIDGRPFARHPVCGGGAYLVDFARYPPNVVRQTAPAERVSFVGLPAGWKQIALWLPHNAEVELSAIRVDAHAQVRPCSATAPRWAHHGSSISHGKEVAGPAGIWPALVAQDFGLDLTALGFSGQCMIDGGVARVIAQHDAAVISLKLGANVVGGDMMRGRTFRSAVHNLLDIIRDRQPETPVLVISPIIAPMLEQHPGPAVRRPSGYAAVPRSTALMDDALTLRRVRTILAECVALRNDLGDRFLHYLDGRELLGEADAPRLIDGLHPDERGHRLIAARLVPVLAGLIAQPAPADAST